MGNKDERIRQKKAYYKGYYAIDISQCKYKCGTACWSEWMAGWENRMRQESVDEILSTQTNSSQRITNERTISISRPTQLRQ